MRTILSVFKGLGQVGRAIARVLGFVVKGAGALIRQAHPAVVEVGKVAAGYAPASAAVAPLVNLIGLGYVGAWIVRKLWGGAKGAVKTAAKAAGEVAAVYKQAKKAGGVLSRAVAPG